MARNRGVGLLLGTIVGWSLLSGCAVAGHASTEGQSSGERASNPGNPPPERTPQTRDATDDQLEEIRFLTSILNNPSNEPATRSGAAVRLMNMGLSEAVRPLEDAIRSGDAALMRAVIRGLAEARVPVAELLDPLVESLADTPSGVLEALSSAVARYGDTAFERVSQAATDRGLPEAERLGPIYALGAFRSRDAAVELMSLLRTSRSESEEIIRAACASLRRGTGLPYGDDPAVWREWWRDARDQPQEQWLTQLVQRLDERLQHAERQNQRLERRLFDAYRDLFPITLKIEEQVSRLPALMEDDLPPLRTFALDRIARLLRDSVRVPDEVQLKLADMLNDEAPAIRIQAARLLEQLNVDMAAERAARRLATETTPDVAAVLMDILMKRPLPSALEALVNWLADSTHGERAANVAWEIVGATELDDDRSAELREALHAAGQWQSWPAHARLLGAIGDSDDVRNIEHLLDSDDPAKRLAAAEAMYRRGLRQPLLDRAHDEIVYPLAVRSLMRDPVDTHSMRSVVSMMPVNDTGRTVWTETITGIAAKLPVAALVEVDDMLTAAPDVPLQLRADVLRRVRNVNGEDGVDIATRVELLTRLARMQLQLNQPLAAHETMETLNGMNLNDAARRVRFEAAVLSGHHDTAAQINPAPEPWVALLARIAQDNITAAVLLRDEIARRFGEELNGELLADFERLSEQLARDSAESNSEPPA